jgi:hypothetical protein
MQPESKGPALEVPAAISGKVLRQLFDSTAASGRSQELKQVLIDHSRVVEDRFRHDEVPEEYQTAIRAYFALLEK